MICLEITAANPEEMKDFDLAYAEEVIARVYALMGDATLAKEFHGKAILLGRAIADPEDRKIFESDLAAEPWFGMV